MSLHHSLKIKFRINKYIKIVVSRSLQEMARLSTVTNSGIYCVFALTSFVVIQASIISDNKILTFQWYENVTAEKVEAEYHPQPTKHLVELTELYDEIDAKFFLQGTNFSSEYPDSISWRRSGGFVDTVFYSYQKHHNLIIRPDDVWTAIVTQFSLYVNANAEALRHAFVNFEGKKKLEVTFYTPINEVPFDVFINKIASLIDENIDPSVASWIRPNFTTTTKNDEVAAGAALMATLQKYFDYSLSLILCGIPEVTILGTVDDWRQIRQRVEKLKQFEISGQDVMGQWSNMLGIIIDEFLSVKQGNEKKEEFWKEAIRVDYKLIHLGCGQENETYLNGWLTAFSAFDKSGKWQEDSKPTKSTEEPLISKTPWLRIRTDNITPGVVSAPIQIYDQFSSEKNYTGAIITGHMGYSVRKDEKTLQPLSGWAMTITGKLPGFIKQEIERREYEKERQNKEKN